MGDRSQIMPPGNRRRKERISDAPGDTPLLGVDETR